MKTDTTNKLNRRSLVSTGALMLAAALPGSSRWVVAQDSSRASSSLDEEFVAEDEVFTVRWDSGLWSTIETHPGVITLRDQASSALSKPSYRIAVRRQEIPWGKYDLQGHIDDWFSQGMLNVRIFLSWEEADEIGFAWTSGPEQARTILMHIYSPIEGHPTLRRGMTFAVLQSAFDRDELIELFQGVSVNDEAISSIQDIEQMVNMFEENLDKNQL